MFFIRASAKVYRGVGIHQKNQSFNAVLTSARNYRTTASAGVFALSSSEPILMSRSQFLTQINRGAALSITATQVRSYCANAAEAASAETSPAAKGAADETLVGQGPTAISVATAVNKIKRQHQQASDTNERRKLEMDAWTQLNTLSEEAIMTAEGKAVALLLNSWAYFSKHWQRGRDGPEIETSSGKKATTADTTAEEEEDQ